MNWPEALKMLDQIKPEDVTPALLDDLSEQLRISALAARHELVAVCLAQGYTSGEIEDGLERFDRYIAEVSEEAIARLLKNERVLH